jgi:hypothetical protein
MRSERMNWNGNVFKVINAGKYQLYYEIINKENKEKKKGRSLYISGKPH